MDTWIYSPGTYLYLRMMVDQLTDVSLAIDLANNPMVACLLYSIPSSTRSRT